MPIPPRTSAQIHSGTHNPANIALQPRRAKRINPRMSLFSSNRAVYATVTARMRSKAVGVRMRA
ncbi:hypothetical protein N7535_006462 [Penicillium sp. DV-2018c]|nr:hypothetical protein N7461_007454 [Penicillium sp. DV-2018c]KAJ5567156.1 hypothetical protein N7535_006462 [Penicillium sp. DV-2018c]